MAGFQESIELPVQGMTCAHCVQTVRNALEAVPGVQSADVQLEPGLARIDFDGNTTDRGKLRQAIETAGYSVADGSLSAPVPALVNIGLGSIPASKSTPAPVQEDWNFAVSGMHCASCVSRVEDAIRTVPGVRSARVNLATERANVTLDPARATEPKLANAVKSAGYSIKRSELTGAMGAESLRKERAVGVAYWRSRLIAGIFLTVPMIAIGYAPALRSFANPWVMLPLATLLMIDLGAPYFQGAWQRLLQGSSNMDTLIALGTTAAYGYSLYHTFSEVRYRPEYLPGVGLSAAYGIGVIGAIKLWSWWCGRLLANGEA